ncbi:MAG: hypothetical protein Q9165_003327 [Trypethelium subeluteriae]
MARTRAQSAGASKTATEQEKQPPVTSGRKRKQPADQTSHQSKHTKNTKTEDASKVHNGKIKTPTPDSNSLKSKTTALIEKYGEIPLSSNDISEPSRPTASTVLAHIFNAMLTSARISHELAAKTVSCVIEAGYADVQTLKSSSWEERTEVLTKGGYTRYREKTATALGDLCEWVLEKWEGDLNNLRKDAEDEPERIKSKVKEIRGLGEVGVNIFCDTMQGLWTCLAPFMDPRSLKTAETIGLGSDVEQIFEAVGRDPEKMAMLCMAITKVRLEKKESEFKD